MFMFILHIDVYSNDIKQNMRTFYLFIYLKVCITYNVKGKLVGGVICIAYSCGVHCISFGKQFFTGS